MGFIIQSREGRITVAGAQSAKRAEVLRPPKGTVGLQQNAPLQCSEHFVDSELESVLIKGQNTDLFAVLSSTLLPYTFWPAFINQTIPG